MTQKFHGLSWQRAAAWVETNNGLLAIALCVCFAVLSSVVAARRPLWYDELLTVSIARLPSLTDLFTTFRIGSDATPPLNALLVRSLGSLFGWSELVVRLPSTIFATVGLLIFFHRLRELTNGLFALVGAAVLLVTFLPIWAFEVRPYALLFFASSLAVFFWTCDTASGKSARTVSALFGLTIMLAIFAHYYGILLILPFIAEEVRSQGLRRPPSFRLSCGILGMFMGLAFQLPFIEAASRRELTAFGAPSLHALQATYTEMLMQFLFVLVCGVLFLSWTSIKITELLENQSRHERLGCFFLAIPMAGYVLAELVTHVFMPRYFIPMLAGFGLALGCLLYRRFRTAPQVPLLILLIAIPLFVQTEFSHIRYARIPVVSHRTDVSDFVDNMLTQFQLDRKQYVLVPTVMSYLEARYYAANPQMIRTLTPTHIPRWARGQNPFGIRYFTMEELRQHARETALVAPSPDLLSDIQKMGFHLQWRITTPEAVVYPE